MIAVVRGDETRPALYELATGKLTVLDHVQGTAPAWTQDGKVYFLLGGGKVIQWSATGRVEEVAAGIPLISTGANSWLNGNFLALDQEGMPLTVRDAGSSQLYSLEWRSR